MERDDVLTLHEPFSQLADFGSCTVGDREVRSEAELIATITDLGMQRWVFFKDTTDFRYPGVLSDTKFLSEVEHTFIIRHPREVIPSHYALNPSVTLPEIGFSRLHELYRAVAAAIDHEPIVIDSDALLDRPEQTVRAYGNRVGLTYKPETLTWSSGMRREWSKTARWHTEAGNSNGFARSERSYTATVDSHSMLAEFYEQELPFYEYLRERSMTV